MSEPIPAGERGRVLAADDDPAMLLLVKESLEPAGYAVETVADGQEAVEAFDRSTPDLVLLDVAMPRMDGLTACSEIRSRKAGLYTPIAMVTACDDLASIQHAYRVGATDFITKPVSWPILSQRLDYMLRASEAFSERVRSEARHRALLDAVPDTILRLDAHGEILDVSLGGSSELESRPPEELIGRRLSDVYPAELAEQLGLQLRRSLQASAQQSCEFEIEVAAAKRSYEARFVASSEDEVIAILRDITDKKTAEAEMYRLAYFDGLTGLPNRRRIRERLDAAISRARRNDREVAILFVDLDDFKRVNDTLGHDKGDLLLQELSQRLLGAVRSTDIVGRIGKVEPDVDVARFGGDEFVVVVSDVRHAGRAAVAVCRRLTESLKRPLQLDGNELTVSASAGIAIFPADGDDAGDLLRHADMAMYHAKSSGRGSFQFYSAPMNERARLRLELETELRRSLERDQLTLHFQPIVDLTDENALSVECLLRFSHPGRGPVPPPEVIQVAEETGLIGVLSEKILLQACEHFREWQGVPGAPVSVAVNLSPHYLATPDVAPFIGSVLATTRLPAESLVVEMTETALIRSPKQVGETLRQLNELGVTISLDDFGTGYSSLSHLLHYPFHQLKIDGTFTDRVGDCPIASAVVAAIIGTGGQLGIDVVVERVETPEQLEVLIGAGCKRAQGYLFSPPVPSAELVEMLQRGGGWQRRAEPSRAAVG